MFSGKNIRTGFQRFSDGTSLHGFTELYYSKTLFWKIVWVLLVASAFVLTSYQLYGSVQNFIHQDSNTVILPATCDEVQFPPLKFCIAHWIYWIDWNGLAQKNVTKETILFAMSYLTNIYSSYAFNISEAEENFLLIFKENHITTLVEFYKIFAIPGTHFNTPVNSDVDLNETEFVILGSGYPHLCYTVAGDKLKLFLSENSHYGKNVYKIMWNALTKPNQIDNREYNSYMAEWITSNNQYSLTEIDELYGFSGDFTTVHANYSNVFPPHILFVNGYSDMYLKLLSQIDEYNIIIKSSASRWKNTKTRKCHEGVATFSSNSTCNRNCFDKSYYCSRFKGPFYSAIQTQINTIPSLLAKNEIYFLNEAYVSSTETFHEQQITTFFDTNITMIYTNNNDETEQESTTMSNNKYTIISEPNIDTTEQDTTEFYSSDAEMVTSEYDKLCGKELLDKIYSDCIANECNVRGCDEWSFDVTVTTKSISDVVKGLASTTLTEAFITYPACGEVLVMRETDSKTWEDFVGNVGGLLGIWTGASILSIFQLFYLCCFAEMTGNKISLTKLLNQKRVQQDLLRASTVIIINEPSIAKSAKLRTIKGRIMPTQDDVSKLPSRISESSDAATTASVTPSSIRPDSGISGQSYTTSAEGDEVPLIKNLATAAATHVGADNLAYRPYKRRDKAPVPQSRHAAANFSVEPGPVQTFTVNSGIPMRNIPRKPYENV